MKYCKKCGMLLEDTHENCIRCGADVTLAENVSLYPIEVMETLEEENQRKKASGKIVAMIIGLVTVLVVLVILFMNGLGGKVSTETNAPEESNAAPAAAQPLETAAESEAAAPTEAVEEPEETPAPTPAPDSRKIKDDKGRYYNYVVQNNDAGDPVFSAIIPEDLTEIEFYQDYEGYCDRYPYMMNFTVSTKENDVRFTYLSPRKMWYKISETGKSRTDLRDLTNYMTYFKYDGPRSYLDALLEKSYPGAKFDLKNEYDVSEPAANRLEELAKARNKELFKKDIGDLAHIGENTTYANMDFESSAKVYEYEITLKDKDMLFCKYYVPSMAFNLTYANTDLNDRGNLTEWYNFAILCFETGNEDDYDDYVEAFDMFVDNALPTDLFMFINESYSKEIKKAVADGKSPEPLTEEKIAKYGKDYKPGTKLDDFDAGVMKVLRAPGALCFKNDDVSIYTSDKDKVAFFDKEGKKVFLSTEEDEYPGDSFAELKLQEPAEEPAADTAAEEAGTDDAATDAAGTGETADGESAANEATDGETTTDKTAEGGSNKGNEVN